MGLNGRSNGATCVDSGEEFGCDSERFLVAFGRQHRDVAGDGGEAERGTTRGESIREGEPVGIVGGAIEDDMFGSFSLCRTGSTERVSDKLAREEAIVEARAI